MFARSDADGVSFGPASQPNDVDVFSACVPLMTVQDNLIEIDEVVSLTIDPESLVPYGDSLGTPSTVQVTIRDDDGNFISTLYSYV